MLLICRRDTAGTAPWPLPRAFVWDPDDPNSLEFVDFPVDANNVDNISEDPFCGGHAFTPEGDVIFVGGTDVWKDVNPPTQGEIWGHDAIWAFVNDASGYDWVRLGEMSRERWYATGTAMVDGSILMTGHEQKPDMYGPETQETFERGTITYSGGVPTGINWQALVQGETLVHENIVNLGCANTSTLLYLGEYPRQHSLQSGLVWWTGADPATQPAEHGFFDLFGCSGVITHRWALGAVGAWFPQNVSRGSVHLVDLTGATSRQFVFDMGGADRYLGAISNQVLRMEDPTTSTLWQDDASIAPDLNFNVFDGNFTILADGSIIRTGGYGREGLAPNFTWPARLKAEVFQPATLFTAPLQGWKKMKEALHERRYHSCAVLLPNGKVLTAGGNDTQVGGPNPEPSWFSVEVFSPPYLFSGPRPRITMASPEVVLGGPTFFVDAILRTTSDGGEFRVALIAPGAATHAFDQGQKYIKLKVSSVTINPNPDAPSQISVITPPNLSIPWGWYMLAVVNSAGIPSGAKWVKVHP